MKAVKVKLPIVQLTKSVVTLNACNVEMEEIVATGHPSAKTTIYACNAPWIQTVSANNKGLEGHVMPRTSAMWTLPAMGTVTITKLQVSISNSLQGRTGLGFTGLMVQPTHLPYQKVPAVLAAMHLQTQPAKGCITTMLMAIGLRQTL